MVVEVAGALVGVGALGRVVEGEGEEAEEPVEGEVVHGVHARHVADGEEEDGGVGGDRVVGLASLWTFLLQGMRHFYILFYY